MATTSRPSTKLSYLNSVESPSPAEPEPDESRPKYFVTFPYPYMNGKLHLGHLYSATKADFMAYYKQMRGYNVLFPFGFHCTGMPISASASKLAEELSGKQVDLSVVEILRSFGIDDPTPFTDPVHWIRTFPNHAIKTLQDYHMCIDWRRSFITTDINPYYDSFVRYQFKRLKHLGLISFGKRYSIFCTLDNQACLDHDRRKGEGLKPVEVMLRKVPLNDSIFLIRVTSPNTLTKLVVSTSSKFKSFSVGTHSFIAEEWVFENLRYQATGVTEHSSVSPTEVQELCTNPRVEITENNIQPKASYAKNPPTDSIRNEYQELFNRKNEKLELMESASFVKIYEPEGLVISRSGSKCVVSLLDQWFLDYGNEDWKNRVLQCISKMELSTETRQKLVDAVSWINKWGCSRSFGLGTRIPWDEQYLIDSLSDSTIYTALYTVKHFLFKDLEGREQVFPLDLVSDSFWQFIFEDVPLPQSLEEHRTVMEACKRSFEYFYPVDLRVSGKDLIGNHLIFFIFNHVALFPSKFWPVRIFTNGYVMLNTKKMSKSEGNFLSAEDALEKFGASATRMCLACCGDTNEDANFEESTANSFVLKLYTLVKSVEELDDGVCEGLNDDSLTHLIGDMTLKADEAFARSLFIQAISKNIREAVAGYDAMAFRDVVKFGFYENLHLIELYHALGGTSRTLVAFAYKITAQLIYPLVPSLSNYLIHLKFSDDLSLPVPLTDKSDSIKAVEYIKELCNRLVAAKKGRREVKVVVSKEYSPWRRACMKMVDEQGAGAPVASVKPLVVAGAQSIVSEFGVDRKKVMLFSMDYLQNKASYILDFDEYETLEVCTPYIESTVDVALELSRDDDAAEPKKPVIQFK